MAYGLKTKGGNKTRNPHANDEWQKGKKIGRKKQIWVWDVEPINGDELSLGDPGTGHWEKDSK